MFWILLVLIVFILIDLFRLHRKVDQLIDHIRPTFPPTDEEIEKILEAEHKVDDK